MRIEYTPNPLYIKVHLEEFEKKELFYKTYIQELEQRATTAYHYLVEPSSLSSGIDEERFKKSKHNALEAISYNAVYGNKTDDNEIYHRVRDVSDMLEEALLFCHCGDCACIPCTCEKCIAEELLGINTIEGLSKYSAYYIDGAFHKRDEHGEIYFNVKTIDEALDTLYNYKPKENDGYEAYHEKWSKQYREAYNWLLKYKNDHGF